MESPVCSIVFTNLTPSMSAWLLSLRHGSETWFSPFFTKPVTKTFLHQSSNLTNYCYFAASFFIPIKKIKYKINCGTGIVFGKRYWRVNWYLFIAELYNNLYTDVSLLRVLSNNSGRNDKIIRNISAPMPTKLTSLKI